MKLIDNWTNKKLRCYFCGSTKSVKYTVNVFDPTISNKLTDVCCCNKCALLQPKQAERSIEQC